MIIGCKQIPVTLYAVDGKLSLMVSITYTRVPGQPVGSMEFWDYWINPTVVNTMDHVDKMRACAIAKAVLIKALVLHTAKYPDCQRNWEEVLHG